jgi:hypothetical protein
MIRRVAPLYVATPGIRSIWPDEARGVHAQMTPPDTLATTDTRGRSAA